MEGAIGQFLLHTRKQNTAQVSRAVQCAGEGGDRSGRQPRAQGEGGCDAKSCCRDWDRASTGGAPPTCQPQQHLCCQEGPKADPACVQTVWSQASVCASKQGPNPAKALHHRLYCILNIPQRSAAAWHSPSEAARTEGFGSDLQGEEGIRFAACILPCFLPAQRTAQSRPCPFCPLCPRSLSTSQQSPPPQRSRNTALQHSAPL